MTFVKGTFSLSILLLLTMASCRYTPLLKYYTPKKNTGFPKFSKQERFKGEANSLRAYDITTYDWSVKVFPESHRLESVMKIDFTLEENQDTIMLDLQHRLKVESVVSSLPFLKWKHSKDLLYLIFSEEIASRTKGSVSIKYSGKPTSLAKEGPIQWKEDKNSKPWISTQTEGIGAHFMMPCKELLYDEPENCIIRVAVPQDLTAVANGRLDSVTSEGSFKRYHWSVSNPINIYNISFNIGDFSKIEKTYLDVRGEDRKIVVYALNQYEEKASKFYDQTPIVLAALEGLYGSFPWWEDGCKIVQSTLGRSAMEHQSAISMGSIMYNDYQPPKDSLHHNTTLVHELAHEWWGNLITGADYCDMWLHEGFATYSEALVIEKLYQPEYYDFYIRRLARFVSNERPVLKPCGVRYNSWVSHKDGDIYNKGALLLHTVRRQLNDDKLFFKILTEALDNFARQNITSQQFIDFFSEKAGQDLGPLFRLYLMKKKPPQLQYSFNAGSLTYKWASPLHESFKLRIVATLGEEKVDLYPSNETQHIPLDAAPTFDIADFGYVLVEEVPSD